MPEWSVSENSAYNAFFVKYIICRLRGESNDLSKMNLDTKYICDSLWAVLPTFTRSCDQLCYSKTAAVVSIDTPGFSSLLNVINFESSVLQISDNQLISTRTLLEKDKLSFRNMQTKVLMKGRIVMTMQD